MAKRCMAGRGIVLEWLLICVILSVWGVAYLLKDWAAWAQS